MEAVSQVSNSQLAASLFVIQFVVVGSVMLGAIVSRYWMHRAVFFPLRIGDNERLVSGMLDIWILSAWLILTLAPLTFTALSLSGWTTIGFQPPELSVRTAATFAFAVDLVVGTWFVVRSGGWSDSPFTSVLVAVPTFAILLEEPAIRVGIYILYTVLVSAGLLYLNAELGFCGTQNARDRKKLNAANWLLSSVMLTLAAWIGLFGAK